jgi:hypothetical protein
MDTSTFNNIIKIIIETDNYDETIRHISNCFYKRGILIHKSELKSFKNNENEYIGYINIFNLNDTFDAILFNKNENKYRDCSDKEKETIISNRIKQNDMPNMNEEKMPWGIFLPKKIKNSGVIMNTFKLFTIDETVGKKTGMECFSLKKNDLSEIFEQLSIQDDKGTKVDNCNKIANELLAKDRLTTIPFYIPKL